MKVIYQGKLRHVGFTLAAGDIFEARVDAIVNSEQTDFVLSGNQDSLSGQIWNRYGYAVQRELDAATESQVLGPGTVIDTSGGQDFKRIFHAGFHDPYDWPDWAFSSADPSDKGVSIHASREFRETSYFAAIGACIAQVLDCAAAMKLESVAFPLIGCGRFGLDEKMLILQFLDAIQEFDGRFPEGLNFNVWLVIRDRAQFESAAGTFLDLLMQARNKLASVQLKQSGVPILDRFANRLRERTSEDWAKWQLCRYAEVAAEVMCYGISRATTTIPETLFEEDRPATFGQFLEKANYLVRTAELNSSAWGASFFSSVLKNDISVSSLREINHQRNNLAHGRQSLPLAKIKKLVLHGLHLESWERIAETDGELRLSDWQPWVRIPQAGSDQIGLLERWQKNSLRYLVPETGKVFKVPRSLFESGDLGGR